LFIENTESGREEDYFTTDPIKKKQKLMEGRERGVRRGGLSNYPRMVKRKEKKLAGIFSGKKTIRLSVRHRW